MRLEQMEYLIEIVNSRSISIAAGNLYMSQPALSRAIKGLEQDLGVTLLFRTVDGVRLTQEGEQLLPMMQDIISRTTALAKQAQCLVKSKAEVSFRGVFHLYTLPVIADSLLAQALEELNWRFPEAEVRIHMLDIEALPDVVFPESADLIIGIDVERLLERAIARSGFHTEPLFTGNSSFVVGQNHPLAGKKIITRNEILTQKLICHYNGIDLNSLYQVLAPDQPPANIVFRSNNTRLIIQMLLKQEVALLTNNLLLQLDYVNNDQLRIIPIKNSRIQYFCLYPEDHPHAGFIREVIGIIKNVRNHL